MFAHYSILIIIISEVHVYIEVEDALKVLKTYKKGRLKSFKNRSDAIAYARTGSKQSCNNSMTTVQEQSSNFKTPTNEELISFKKLIEAGDLKAVKSIVWENPKYLISSGDTPAILQVNI